MTDKIVPGWKRFLAGVLLGFILVAAGCGRHAKVLQTGAGPTSLALDAWGRYLYVACEGAGRIQVFDLQKHKKIAEAIVQAGPLRLYLDQDNRTLRVLSRAAKQMLTFTVPEMKLTDTFPLPDGPVAMLVRDQQYLFCCPDANLLRTYVGKNPLPVIEIGLAPMDIAAQPDSNTVWVANDKANEVAAVNVERGMVIKRVHVESNPTRLVPAVLDAKLFVLCAGRELPDQFSKIQLIDCLYQAAGLTWRVGIDARDMIIGPTGKNLYLVDKDYLKVISVNTGEQILQTQTGKNPRAMAVSPDGTRVYVSCRDEHAVYWYDLKKELLAER